jgi:hypothetical protein
MSRGVTKLISILFMLLSSSVILVQLDSTRPAETAASDTAYKSVLAVAAVSALRPQEHKIILYLYQHSTIRSVLCFLVFKHGAIY